MERCPVCGSGDVRGAKFGMSVGSLVEFGCLTCGLMEYRSNRAVDYREWLARWHGPGPRPAEQSPHRPGFYELPRLIAEDPDNDALRFAFADAVQPRLPARAEFVRLQVARYNDEAANGAAHGRPGDRENELLALWRAEWNPAALYHRPSPECAESQFERGFAAGFRIDPATFDIVCGLVPVEHLDLSADGSPTPVLLNPKLSRLRSLGLSGLGLGDDEAITLATRSRLDRLRWLDLRDNAIGERGVAALLASPAIRRIPVVLLRGNPADPCADDLGVLPDAGAAVQRRYGHIPWLHRPAADAALPDRYHTGMGPDRGREGADDVLGTALAAVIADPDAAEPRLAYADAVETSDPDRAEFIRLELWMHHRADETWTLWRPASEYGALHRYSTLRARTPLWAAPVLPWVISHRAHGSGEQRFPEYGFRRGFVEFVWTVPSHYLDALATLAPIQHLNLDIGSDEERAAFRRLVVSPHARSLRSLGVWNAGLTDEDAEAIAASENLAGCWWMHLAGNEFTARGIEALAASPRTRRAYLILDDNPGETGLDWRHDGFYPFDPYLPERGRELERRYGRIPWLHHVYGAGKLDRYAPQRFTPETYGHP